MWAHDNTSRKEEIVGAYPIAQYHRIIGFLLHISLTNKPLTAEEKVDLFNGILQVLDWSFQKIISEQELFTLFCEWSKSKNVNLARMEVSMKIDYLVPIDDCHLYFLENFSSEDRYARVEYYVRLFNLLFNRCFAENIAASITTEEMANIEKIYYFFDDRSNGFIRESDLQVLFSVAQRIAQINGKQYPRMDLIKEFASSDQLIPKMIFMSGVIKQEWGNFLMKQIVEELRKISLRVIQSMNQNAKDSLNFTQLAFDEMSRLYRLSPQNERKLGWIILVANKQQRRQIIESKQSQLTNQEIGFITDYENKFNQYMALKELDSHTQSPKHKSFVNGISSPSTIRNVQVPTHKFQFHVEIDPTVIKGDRKTPSKETIIESSRQKQFTPRNRGMQTLDTGIMQFSDQKLSLSPPPPTHSNDFQNLKLGYNKSSSKSPIQKTTQRNLTHDTNRYNKPQFVQIQNTQPQTVRTSRGVIGNTTLIRTHSQLMKSRRIESFEKVMQNLKHHLNLPPPNLTPRKISKPFQ